MRQHRARDKNRRKTSAERTKKLGEFKNCLSTIIERARRKRDQSSGVIFCRRFYERVGFYKSGGAGHTEKLFMLLPVPFAERLYHFAN